MRFLEKIKKFLQTRNIKLFGYRNKNTAPDRQKGNSISEEMVDEEIEESFPSSDPPSWTLGTKHKDHKHQ